MARSFHHSLLAAVVAAVVGGSALAQTPLQEAVTLLRLNQRDEAKAKLHEILSSDPSNEEAHSLYMSVSQDEWYMLMTEKGEIQQIAQSILDRAKVAQKERSRDEDAIKALVATATSHEGDYGTRQAAVNKLVTEHGEFAVPALCEKLGNADDPDGQIHAISALKQIGAVAVLPLIEALKSTNDQLVQNAAAALSLIGDARATPFMAHLANDDRQAISMIANKYLSKMGVRGNAVDLMLAQAGEYVKGIVPVGGYSQVVWKLVDDKLVATDVPALLYPTELAKSVAADAVRASQGSLPARSALAQANLAEATLIAQGDESTAELQPVAAELKIAALATGVDALRAALEAGLRERIAPVAIGAIRALADAEIIDSVADSTLVEALNSTDKRVKYAAAEALVRASRGANVPMASRVVDVLAEAVTEEKVHTIQVIAPTMDSQAAVASTSKLRGLAVDASGSAVEGIRDLLVNPNVDVVVLNEFLPDRQPEDVIGNIKKDPRMANTRIVIVTKDEEAAKARFGEEVGYVVGPLTAENLPEAVNKALDGISSPAGDRAEAYAKDASNALAALAARKADISGALSNLALQLSNRPDDVTVPAAKAIGLAGTAAELPALVAALTGGSDALKKAAAEAIGNVLGRMATCPDDVAVALIGAIEGSGDVELRTAVAIAIGKAKLSTDKKLELMKKLGRVAGASSEG